MDLRPAIDPRPTARATRAARATRLAATGLPTTVVLAVVLLAAVLGLGGCSGDETKASMLDDVKEQDRLAVDVATNRQMQIGYQIASVASDENALDLCFEMCNRSNESCHLSASVCNVSKRYPNVVALKARCDVTRERCRVHRTKVPRQCPCE